MEEGEAIREYVGRAAARMLEECGCASEAEVAAIVVRRLMEFGRLRREDYRLEVAPGAGLEGRDGDE